MNATFKFKKTERFEYDYEVLATHTTGAMTTAGIGFLKRYEDHYNIAPRPVTVRGWYAYLPNGVRARQQGFRTRGEAARFLFETKHRRPA